MQRLGSEEIRNILDRFGSSDESDEDDDDYSATVQQVIQEEETDFHAVEPVELVEPHDDLQNLVNMAHSFGGTRETTSEAAETPNDPEEEPQYLLLTSAASSGTPTSTIAGVEVSMHDHDPVPSTSTCVRRSDRAQQTPRATYVESSSDEEEEINATTILQSAPVSRRGRRQTNTIEEAVAIDLHGSTKLVQPLSKREKIP